MFYLFLLSIRRHCLFRAVGTKRLFSLLGKPLSWIKWHNPMAITETDVWIIDNKWTGLMLGETMSITRERECLTVLRGKLKQPQHHLHQESLRPHFYYTGTLRQCWRITQNISLVRLNPCTKLIICMNDYYRITIFNYFHSWPIKPSYLKSL